MNVGHASIYFSLSAAAAGILFGLGLALSGMADPQRVLGFLDVFGSFDPTLIFVLGGAVGVTALAFPIVLRGQQPLLAERFDLPIESTADKQMLIGSAIFGIGWGLAGYCPGPALVGLGAWTTETLYFVPAMLVGALIHRAIMRR